MLIDRYFLLRRAAQVAALVLAVALVAPVAVMAQSNADPDSALANGQPDIAQALASARLAQVSNDEDALRTLGILALWKNQLDTAAARLAPLVTKHPADTMLVKSFAETRFRQGRWADAVALYTRAGEKSAAFALALKAAGPQAYATTVPDSGTRLYCVGNDESLIVRITINGHDGYFIVDTGSRGMFLDSAFAAAAGVRKLGTINLVNVGNVHTQEGVGVIDSMGLGAATIRHIPAGISNPAYPLGPSLNGLLGFDVLSHFRLTINYPNRFIVLEPRNSRRVPGANEIALPLWISSDSRPLIAVGIGRDTIPLLLDSGTGGRIVALTSALLGRLHIATVGGDTANKSIEGAGGNVHADPFTIDQMQIGPLSWRGVEGEGGVIPGGDLDDFHFLGIMAGDFFSDRQITFDPVAMQLVLSQGSH